MKVSHNLSGTEEHIIHQSQKDLHGTLRHAIKNYVPCAHATRTSNGKVGATILLRTKGKDEFPNIDWFWELRLAF